MVTVTTLPRNRVPHPGRPRAGVVDPDLPALTVWDLRDRAYVERAHVGVDEAFETETPFPMTVVPAQLVD